MEGIEGQVGEEEKKENIYLRKKKKGSEVRGERG